MARQMEVTLALLRAQRANVVRFAPDSDRIADIAEGPRNAKTGNKAVSI
jgi:hypothetical protein